MAKFKAGTTITSSLEVSGNIIDLSGDVGTSGQVLVSTGTGTDWTTLSSSSSTGITNYIKCVCASATTLNGSGTASTLSWMSTTPSFSNGFSNPTATQITVPNDGLYLIGLNLNISQTNTADNLRYNHGFEIEINGTTYYVEDTQNSPVYEQLEDEDVGDEIGELKDGKLTLY